MVGQGQGKLESPNGCHLQGLQMLEKGAQDDESKTNYAFEKLGCVCQASNEVYKSDAVKVHFTWLGSMTLLLKRTPALQS